MVDTLSLMEKRPIDDYVRLPDYKPSGLSDRSHLTSTDCHRAMQTTIRKACLIGFKSQTISSRRR